MRFKSSIRPGYCMRGTVTGLFFLFGRTKLSDRQSFKHDIHIDWSRVKTISLYFTAAQVIDIGTSIYILRTDKTGPMYPTGNGLRILISGSCLTWVRLEKFAVHGPDEARSTG